MTEQEIIKHFEIIQSSYKDLEEYVVGEIYGYLNSQPPSNIPKIEKWVGVKHRIKKLDSFLKKSKRYTEKGLNPFDAIHDILGITIICYSQNDVQNLAIRMRSLFKIVEGENVEEFGWRFDENEFGHQATKIDFEITPNEAEKNKKKHLADLKFELQITTSLMNTWSFFQHDWYKTVATKPRPKHLLRKLNAVNALLELADSELAQIQTESLKYQNYDLNDDSLDADKLQAFLDTYFYEWQNGSTKQQHNEGMPSLLADISKSGVFLREIIAFYLEHKNAIIDLEKEQMLTWKPRVRWAQAGIIRIILDLMSPKYASRHEGRVGNELMLQQYENWRHQNLKK